MLKAILFLLVSVIVQHVNADVVEDYGFDMDQQELRESGFRVKVEGGIEKFEKQTSDASLFLEHNRNQQTVIGRVQDSGGERLQITQYGPKSEKALSRTTCQKKSGEAPYSCHTQTYKMCRSFNFILDKGFGGGAEKLKECDQILRNLETDLKGVEAAQVQHRSALTKSLGLKESGLEFVKPTRLPQLKEVLNELDLCAELDNTLIGSKWEFDNESPRKSHKKTNAKEAIQ